MASDEATTGNGSGSAPKKMKHRKEDFEMGQLLGDGAFAKVVEGTVINEESPQFGTKYAIKVMDKRHIMKHEKIKYVNIEKRVFLATAEHPFICSLHFTFQDSYSLFMVLDLCDDAELSYQIWKYCGLSEQLTRFYAAEIVSCLEYMHSAGIYHRDIKPENVLLHKDGHIRLTDFGTAKITDAESADHTEQGDGGRDRKGSFVGTAQYVPPELLNKDSDLSYPAMDFWALGILIFHCLCNATPFEAPNEYLTFKRIEEHQYSAPDSLSDAAKAVIDAFLTKDFRSRLGMKGFAEIQRHPFFDHVASWEWADLKAVEAPNYPQTPEQSPIFDEEKRNERELRGSIYGGDDGLDGDQKVDALAVVEPSASNQDLHGKWKQFLSGDEEIEMGSTVERNRFFGMASEKSVMLLTSAGRVLLIDADKMEIRKNGNIPRASIVSCNVIDKESFELRFVKTKETKVKFRCSGPKAGKWKAALEKSMAL